MLFVHLTTIVGIGEIFLIVCHLLLSATEIDSKSNFGNQVSTLKLEGRIMEDDVTPKVVVNNKATMKRFLKRTPRKKRNFVNAVKKYCHVSINTTTSTCTPFFIRRSKMTHRKTARLKSPMYYNTMQADVLSANEPLSQKQNKGKIKKLFFPKHTLSSSLFVTDSSELLTGKDKDKYKTTNTLNLTEPPTEKIILNKSSTTEESTGRFNVAVNTNVITLFECPLSTNLPNSKTTDNYLSLGTCTAGSVADESTRTQRNQVNRSTVDLSNKTTNYSNTSGSFLNKFHLKDIFHFKKAKSSGSSQSDRITTTFEPGKVLQHYNTSAVTSSTSNNTTAKDQQTTRSNKKHIHHQQRDFSINSLTEKPKECTYSKEPTLEHTDDIHETQIPPSPSQHTISEEDDNSESGLSTIKSSSNSSLENERKYMHFRNILHRQQRTTLNKDVDPSELEKHITLKPKTVDSGFVSGSSFTCLMVKDESESKTDSYSRGNENLMTRLFNFRRQKNKEGKESNYSTSESTVSKEKEVFATNLIQSTVDAKIDSDDNSNITNESSNITTVHNPFKIKYLIRFRSPISSTQSGCDESSWLGLTSSKTYNDKKGFPHSKEHDARVDVTPEPMITQDNSGTCLRDSNQLDYDRDQGKFNNNQYILTKKSLMNIFTIKGRNSSDTVKLESDASSLGTTQLEKSKVFVNIKNIIGCKKHKNYGKNKNSKHDTSKPINFGNRVSHKQLCCYTQNTEANFKEKFNVTVYGENGGRFRDWFFGKTIRPADNKGHKNEDECTFRWCLKPKFINNASITESPPSWGALSTCPLNNTPETGQKNTDAFSSFPPEKKLKNFFHFKTSHIQLPEYNTTMASVPDYGIEECNDTKPIQPNETTKKSYEKNNTPHSTNIYTHPYSSRRIVKPVPVVLTSIKSTTKNLHNLEVTPQKSDLNSSDKIEPNVSTIKVYGREKVKQFFYKFHTAKTHSSNNTNCTVTLNPDFSDYTETKVETKKHKKYSNRTVLHNASDVNDTSFNVMAYVMKPLDSLVSVFKALSPNSVTKIGDVNATDIKNGSIPNHLQPPNSSIVILAVNNTNATSRDVHESKLAMALDLLGGMYHCVFNSFVEARPEDIHFYLYTRSGPEEPEELLLPPETLEEIVTDSADLPEPVLEREMTSELPVDKREIEYDENDYEDYEFEALNPAKSEIQSKWFNVRAETKVLIHGYLQDYQTDIMVSMREAYLARGAYNVVVVDWSVLVGENSCYPVVASRGLRQVGGLLARLLNLLVQAGVSPNNIHIVGFSLGAHVAGHAGTFLTHGLVSRITGLDPALPYVPMAPEVSLNSDDAVFVDIIHSAAGLLGQSGPMGHVDFYPNGGSQQPGCEVSSLSCSHRRAALYFIESINSDSGLHATKCESWHHFQAGNCSYAPKVLMGEPCSPNSRGKYYLVTGYRSPFALQPEEHSKVEKSLLMDLFYDSEDL